MLDLMIRCVFATLLGVTLAAGAHEGAEPCAGEAASSRQPSTLAAGTVLVRGEPLPTGRAPVKLSSVLAHPEDGRAVLVEGVVRRACTRMGCWMELVPAEGGAGVRVTFKDHGFFVPTDSEGARARVQGTLRVTQLSAEQAEHLRSEGASVAAGTGREVSIVASGVELRR